MFFSSRYFPLLFALLQTTRHVGSIGYDYWVAAQNERALHVIDFVKADLARPLFELDAWCGAWTHYSSGQTAAFGVDLPAYMAATMLLSTINWSEQCLDALTMPRGQILVAALVTPLWFLVGLSIQRLAQRRWRQMAAGRFARAALSLGLLPASLSLFFLLSGVLALFVSGIALSLRLIGIGLWMVYPAIFAAERLRAWPFAGRIR